MPLKKLNLYFQTLRHVKPTQLYHQVYYRLRNRFWKSTYPEVEKQGFPLQFEEEILYPNSFLGNHHFRFLNLEKEFSTIDWNFSEYGKLWTYNLNYFEYLNQENNSKEQGLKLINDYIAQKEVLKDGLEPYPISLRGINWIKFLSREGITKPEINSFLYQDYARLKDNLEYHLLANHLLENGFSMLFGAFYFQEDDFYKVAKSIMEKELEEQILLDGAHYELSPMYHQIILHRVLDSYNLVKNNPWKTDNIQELLKSKAELMLGWLENMTFNNGEIPYVNDAAPGIAPNSHQLFEYAEKLNLSVKNKALKESGYRKFDDEDFEIFMDVGQIAPSYQPGHSHADNLQFVLNYKNQPIIIDTGISTYDKNGRRQLERSTHSHNTVTINGKNSTNIWSGFRAAERAKTTIIKDEPAEIEAFHNGYRKMGLIHHRSFQKMASGFMVEDRLEGKNGEKEAVGHLHFHPDVSVEIDKNTIIINKDLRVELSGIDNLIAKEYKFAEGYNLLKAATKVEYTFKTKAELFLKAI